jgi:hypothetical protein
MAHTIKPPRTAEPMPIPVPSAVVKLLDFDGGVAE